MDCLFRKSIVADHCDYFVPFLVCYLFVGRRCDYSIDVVFKGCQLMIMWVIGVRVYCDVHIQGCPRRNVKYFGRVFLMLNYTEITQNTYIQS